MQALSGTTAEHTYAARIEAAGQRERTDRRWERALRPIRRNSTVSARWQVVEGAVGRRSGLPLQVSTSRVSNPAVDGPPGVIERGSPTQKTEGVQ